jgi:Fe-S-cluster-containing hydrogenase component 2
MTQKLNERLSELQQQLREGMIARRDFLRYATLLGVSVGAAEALAACAPTAEPTATKAAVPPTSAPPPTAVPPTAAPPPPPTDTPAPAPVTQVEAKAGHMIRFNPYLCSGCLLCAVACSEKWGEYYFPEETKNTVNLEFSRIRPMRFQFVDVVNVCWYCSLYEFAEGSSAAPCVQVCPQDAIVITPEGEGVAEYTGMGYMSVDRDACLGLELCGRCSEICEDQFGSGISYDPIEHKAQICSRCGGVPACVEACPEPEALNFVPQGNNGRYFAEQPAAYAELLYAKMYGSRREL